MIPKKPWWGCLCLLVAASHGTGCGLLFSVEGYADSGSSSGGGAGGASGGAGGGAAGGRAGGSAGGTAGGSAGGTAGGSAGGAAGGSAGGAAGGSAGGTAGGSAGGAAGGSAGGAAGGGTAGGAGGGGFDAGPPLGRFLCGNDGGTCIGGQQKCCSGNSSGAYWDAESAYCTARTSMLCAQNGVWLECHDSSSCPSGMLCCFGESGSGANTKCASICPTPGFPVCAPDGGGQCPGGEHCGALMPGSDGLRLCQP